MIRFVLLAGAGTLAALVFVVHRGTTAGRSTAEDRRRTAVLAEDPLLALEIAGLEPDTALTSWPGGGRGPTLRPTEVKRHYSTQTSTDVLIDQLIEAAVRTGWHVGGHLVRENGAFIHGSRRDKGFGVSLRIHITTSDRRTEVVIRLETTAAAGAPH